jgi:outer membrane protein assembly factor BamB
MRPHTRLLFLVLFFVVGTQVSDALRRRSPAGVELLWTFDAGGCLSHTPTVAGDMVYIASGNGVLRQVERATGKLRWISIMGRNSSSCMFRGPLLLANDLVVAGASSKSMSIRGSVRAVEGGTGRQRWMQSAGLGLAPSLSRLGRRVFVPTVDGELWCLNLDTGERVWSVPLTVGDWGSPAVAIDRVFVGAASGSVSALNAATGRVEWRTQLGAPITTSVRRGKTALFVGTLDGRIHRIALDNGQVLVSRQLDSRLVPRGTLAVTADSLLVQLAGKRADQQVLVSLDRSLKHVMWRIAAANRWSTTRVFTWKNSVALGTAWGNVFAYCAADGSLAWTHKMDGTVRAIGGADDVLYIGTTDGRVEAVRPPPVCSART